MNSPFPGIDPWLEQFWGDVHTAFMVYARDALNADLPTDLQARVEEGLSIDSEEYDKTYNVRPDVSIVESTGSFGISEDTSSVAVAPAVYVPLVDDSETARHIAIIESRSGRVITVIELLSPGNKSSEDRLQEYRAKSREYLAARINLVEIDLLRTGRHILQIPEEKVPLRLLGKPLICVRRTTRRGAELYGASIRDPLPVIGIPLRPHERDVALALQPVFDEIYRKGRYDRIDYRSPPVPKLSAEDEAWASELLRSQGRL